MTTKWRICWKSTFPGWSCPRKFRLRTEDGLELRLSLEELNLHSSVFREMKKLLIILLTMPMTTAEPERLFSTLKRIKTSLRNSIGQSRLNGLAAISVHTQFFESEAIKENIIDEFAAKKERTFIVRLSL